MDSTVLITFVKESWFKYVVSAAIFLGFIVLAYFASFLLSRAIKIASKTKTSLDDQILTSLRSPLKVVFFLTGLYLAVFYILPSMTVSAFALSKVFFVFGAILAAFVLARITKEFFRWYTKELSRKTKTKVDETLFSFVRKVLAVAIYAIAILIVLDKFGIQIGPLLAGLGIAGLAVALALQDTLSNLFSAFYIVADRPVRVGDYVEIEGGVKGYVKDISWRSTRIQTLGGNMVMMPNSKLAQSVITNYYLLGKEMSVVVPIGVAYGSDLDKVEKITIQAAKKVMASNAGAVKDFQPFIRYNELADSSINISVILRVKDYVGQYLLKHEFYKELVRAYAKAGIQIPFPQMDVRLKKD